MGQRLLGVSSSGCLCGAEGLARTACCRIELLIENRWGNPAVSFGAGPSITFQDSGPSRASVLVAPAGHRRFRIEQPVGPLWPLVYGDVIEAEPIGDDLWRFKWLITKSQYRQESFWFSNSAARGLGLRPILGEIVAHGGVWQTWERMHTTVLSVAYRLPYNPRVRLWKVLDDGPPGAEGAGSSARPSGTEMMTSWCQAGRLAPILDEILADGGSWRIWERKNCCSIVNYRAPKDNPLDPNHRVLEFLKALRRRRRACEQTDIGSAKQ
jgi:hypothetical protein